jgi:hypothetical protein
MNVNEEKSLIKTSIRKDDELIRLIRPNDTRADIEEQPDEERAVDQEKN